MTEQEKIQFLVGKIKELDRITSDIEHIFPEKSFKLDGILIGNIVEVLTAHSYGIKLYKQSEKAHDGEVGGRKVQIKGTQGNGSIVFRHEPEYLLVEFLDKKSGTIIEIYNGPGHLVWEYRSFVPSMNHYTIRVNKLLEMNGQVPEQEKIRPMIPIEKYSPLKKESILDVKKPEESKKASGRTLVEGYLNKNNQKNLGCLNKPGNHYNQTAYQLQCGNCGHLYEANGCDVAIRKCPKCM